LFNFTNKDAKACIVTIRNFTRNRIGNQGAPETEETRDLRAGISIDSW